MEIIGKLPPEFISFLRFSAVSGLLALTVILINFNHSKFSHVFGDRSRNLWWLFLVFSVVPLMFLLFMFNFIVGRSDLRQYGQLVLQVFGRNNSYGHY
jgi:hypothetical protein